MRARLFLFFLLCSFAASAQSYSKTIDSLTRLQTAHFSRAQSTCFDSLLMDREWFKWLQRVDTMPCDYAFIEETYVSGHYAGDRIYLLTDSSGLMSDRNLFISERYFVQSDTIPKYVFLDGDAFTPSEVYNSFLGWYTQHVIYPKTLHPLMERYAKLQPNQELDYNKQLVWEHGCVTSEDAREAFRQRRTRELKNMYRIQTMVDKINNRVVVSVQTPPLEPEFEVVGYNVAWDW